jgi:hypothetical protein
MDRRELIGNYMDKHLATTIKEAVNDFVSDKENVNMFVDKIMELENDMMEEMKFMAGIYRRQPEQWLYELVKKMSDERCESFNRQIKKMRFYKDMCAGRVKTAEVSLDIIKSIPIKDIVGVKMNSQTKSRGYFPCPLHNETKPSFVWYKDNNSFYCFGCGAGGSVIDLYMAIYKVPFKEALVGLKYYI